MHLLVDQVVQFEHIHISDIDALDHLLTRHTIVEYCFAIFIDLCQFKKFGKFFSVCPFKDRCGKFNSVTPISGIIKQFFIAEICQCFLCIHQLRYIGNFSHFGSEIFDECLFLCFKHLCDLLAQLLTDKPQVNFQNLPDVHTAWYAQWIQDKINWSSVFHIRHICFRNDIGDDTFVSVATRHLVPDLEFSFGCDINFNQLRHTAGKNIIFFQYAQLLFVLIFKSFFLLEEIVFERVVLRLYFSAIGEHDTFESKTIDLSNFLFRDTFTLFILCTVSRNITCQIIFGKEGGDSQHLFSINHQELVMMIAIEHCLLLFKGLNGSGIFLIAFFSKDFDVYYHTLHRGRTIE